MVYRYPWLLEGFAVTFYMPWAFGGGWQVRVKGLA